VIGTGWCAHRRVACGRYRGRELTAKTPRERGDRGEPHCDVGGCRGGAVWPSDGGPRWQQKFLDGAAFGAWRTRVGGRDWMRWRDGVLLGALHRAGRLAGAADERSRWRPMEFNGAVVLSLESAPRGSGNGGVAPLRKGKWRQRGLGHGGGARRDGSRPDGRWRRGIGPDEGDKGGAGRVGCKGRGGRVGRMPLGPARRENKEESGMGHKDDRAEMILGYDEKKKKAFGF
jgi:hypothetical protein